MVDVVDTFVKFPPPAAGGGIRAASAQLLRADFANYIEPKTYAQSQQFPDAAEWRASVDSELKSLIDKEVLTFVDKLPPGTSALPTRFVFKLKVNSDGTLDKYMISTRPGW